MNKQAIERARQYHPEVRILVIPENNHREKYVTATNIYKNVFNY